MKLNILKRGVILLIAVIMCLSTFVSVGALNAFADEVSEQDKTVVFSFPRDGDENYTAEWGHEELHYMNGWSQKESKRTHIYAIGSWEGNICYCIEPGTTIDNDQTVNSNNEDYWKNYPSEYNQTITPDDIKMFIGRIMQYGYCGTVTTAWRSQNEEDADKMSHAIATQFLIWETIVGERDENFNHVDSGECDAILDTMSVNHPLYDRIMTYYNSMVKSVQNHGKIPSFFKKSASSAQSVTLSWNGSKYTATLTDTNNVLGNYTFTTNNSKVTCSVSGNKLTVSSSTAINSEVTITANKVNGKRKGMVVWGDGIYDTGTGDIQDLVTFSAEVDDPVVGYVKVKVSSGSVKIVKTSEDGKVSGVKFTVVGNGINTTVTTNANGEITVPNLTAGTYTVNEVVGNVYEPQESRTVTVVAGQTSTVTFNNTLKRGNLVVTKTSEDGLVSGVKFRLYGKADNGMYVNEYAVTDSSGKAHFNDVLIGSNYTLEEVDTKAYYITPAVQNTTIEWNKTTEGTFYNQFKKGNVKGEKVDEDGFTIAGALFGLFKPDETVFTEETALMVSESNEIGVFGFENVPYGNWIIRELKPALAFVLNEDIYEVNITEDEQIIEITAVNRFIIGSVRVWKLDEEAPDSKLSNAVFAVYCDVDGNGEFNAEIDMLVGELTELESGLYGMDNLRYNGYFLHEEKAPDGFIKDDNYYHFEIRNDGDVIYIENKVGEGFTNKPILGNVQTTKVDEEYPDNKLSGAVFEIYLDTDGDSVFNAGIDTLIGEMSETEIGVYTYEALRMGGYFLYEKTAPIGFVKNDNYYYFEIIEDGKTVVVENEAGVGFANKPITGELKILKIDGETKEPLANVGFRVMDTEGNIIEEAHTDENGIVTFELRYGEYTYCEFSPLEDYYANNEVYPFAIIEDGEVIDREFENDPISESTPDESTPDAPPTPQAGDEYNMLVWFILLVISVVGIVLSAKLILKVGR